MDESLLTGEPDLIRKQAGDALFSGSFCVTDAGYFRAEKVGADSFANRLTATARNFQVTYTPLQRQIDFVVRLVMLAVVVPDQGSGETQLECAPVRLPHTAGAPHHHAAGRGRPVLLG